MTIQIKKAVREHVYLKIGITGPTGSGKTWGAIGIAKGLTPHGKILVIDTENRSASYYASKWNFDVVELDAPFLTQKYLEALNAALENNYEAVVIDSLTHEWAASGGILDQKAAKDSRGGNSFTNWGEMKSLHNKFVESLLQSHIHVVATLRSKMEYALEQDERGKSSVRRLGLAPISSDGMEYEFGVVYDLDRNTHLAIASKDRTALFEGRNLNLNEAVGKELSSWLVSTPEPLTASAPATAAPAMATPAAPAEKAPEPSPAIAAGAPQAQAGVPDKAPAKLEHTDRAAWDDAMADLAMVTRDMVPNTRSKLCQEWIKAGPEKLADLLREITALKDIQQPPAPTNVGHVLQQLPAPAKLAVSTDAQAFADAVAEGPPCTESTDEPNGGISPAQYQALNAFILAYGLNRNAFRAYCAKLNYLLPGANGPTLARMTVTAFVKLREDLTNTTMAPGGKETWSQRRIRIVNGTNPIFQPVEATS